MEADRVVIDELLLRLPGIPSDSARAIAADVAQRLGNGLVEAQPRASLGRLDIRVTPPKSLPPNRLAEWLATHILGSLLR